MSLLIINLLVFYAPYTVAYTQPISNAVYSFCITADTRTHTHTRRNVCRCMPLLAQLSLDAVVVVIAVGLCTAHSRHNFDVGVGFALLLL